MAERMEIRDLRAFLAVADDLSFKDAAARLSMSQSSLSQAISRFEHTLGVQLFERGQRRAPELTPHGRVLMEEAKSLLDHVDRVEAVVTDDPTRAVPLKVSAISSAYAGLLPRIVPVLSRKRPQTKITFVNVLDPSLGRALSEGMVDIGFGRLNAPPPGLTFALQASEPLYAALPRGHRLADRPSIALAELSSDPFVIFHRDEGNVGYDAIVAACIRAGFSPAIRSYSVDDMAMLSTISCGLGVSLMPSISTLHAFEGVVYVPLDDEQARTPLSLVTRSGNAFAAVADFADIVRDELSRQARAAHDKGVRSIVFPT